ncbi:zinc finger protein 280D isoform X2 [Engystomops pustulosus]|uniref:zinc finger protein 280D isoform X2 n=1 Tax=Engystomops pustulosus TaxID=76066 RepID=UPI003AFB69F7
MAELLMECEEEELEPWQQKSKAIVIDDDDDDDDDDELIFVREISVSKTTNTNKATEGQQFARAENGNKTHQVSNNHYKPPASTPSVTQPVQPMYHPVTRPVISPATVQPLARPVGMQEAIRRPAPRCMPLQQSPRANPVMQTATRPQTFVTSPLPVYRNPSVPSVSQPALRPVTSVTAQPIILNQGYIMTSTQLSSNNSNVMYALRPSTALTQYQNVQTFTAPGNSTSSVRPQLPLPQVRPITSPTRAASGFIHRPNAPAPSMTQTTTSQIPGLKQPILQQHGQKNVFMKNTAANMGRNENALMEKRHSTIDLTDDSPEKPNSNENVLNKRPLAASTKASNPMSSATLAQNTKGSNTITTPTKNGTPFPRACPKCNIHFNLLEPMKKHMTYCCPEKIQSFFRGVLNLDASKHLNPVEDNERGKLIMLVSDFYYGRYPGDFQLIQKEEKTHSTFKCFSCQKLLRNNIKFMNHMKHHLELEKQSTESWENHTTCHHCYRQFSTPFQLQCHIESSHTLYESTTICKICELSFETEQILLQHMKESHKPGEMPYVCQVCNYRSSIFVDVDNHFRSTHENTKNLLCPFCLKVIRSGTPYMQHYIKHQNKGIYRCTKCRLQFLTCKEKMDHKTQHHRTFRKPKQLEGLPPGTKVTIRASVGVSSSTVSSPTSSISRNLPAIPTHPSLQLPTYTIPLSPPKMATTSLNNNLNPLPKKYAQSAKNKSSPKKPGTNASKKIKMINTALQNLSVIPGIHKCVECHRQVVDFEGHFHTYVHCTKCKFRTSCNKAYTNHVLSCHSKNSSKRSKASKKLPKDKRRITVVCLNCDFLSDVSGLDDMATHLSANHTHTCQVVTENVSIISSTHEGDMSIRRLQSPVELKQISGQEEKSVSHVDGTTDESMEEEYIPETKKEDHSSGSSMASPGHTNTLLGNTEVTSVGQVNAAIETPGSCSPKSEEDAVLIDSCKNDDCDLVPEKVPCEITFTEPNENTINVTKEQDNLCLELMEDPPDSDHVSDDVGFEQYLWKQAPDSICSDISEPSSIHLDPLIPSEVLEHEATEILQKGTVSASPQGRMEDKVEDNKDSSINVSATERSKAETHQAFNLEK